MAPGNPRLRVLYTVWAFLECLGFGGLIYGWGSLVYVLKDEGLYSNLCKEPEVNATANNSSVVLSYSTGNVSAVTHSSGKEDDDSQQQTCAARDARLALVFTIGSAMFCVGCFIMGQINFKFGTRISRVGAAILFIAGALMVGFTSNDVPWLVFPGLSLLGTGGITYLMTNMQISVLFPVGGSAVVGLFCGGFDASAGVQLMVKMGYENGISRQTSYIIIACAHLLTLISTFFFLPKDFIKKPSSPNRRPDDIADDKDAAIELTGKNEADEVQEEKRSLKSCMLSPIYILHVIWLSILQLRFYFLLGSQNKTLETLLDSDKEKVSHYTNVSMYILMCGLFTSPFAGVVCDLHVRLFKNSQSSVRRVLMPSVIPLAVTTTLCIIMSALLLIKDPQVLYAVYVFLLFFRSFMYTLAAGYLSAIFPSEYFGIMYGILIIIGGITSMFQYALFTWAEASGFEQVNLFLLVLMFVTYAHPLYQWFVCRQAERTGSMLQEKK